MINPILVFIWLSILLTVWDDYRDSTLKQCKLKKGAGSISAEQLLRDVIFKNEDITLEDTINEVYDQFSLLSQRDS